MSSGGSFLVNPSRTSICNRDDEEICPQIVFSNPLISFSKDLNREVIGSRKRVRAVDAWNTSLIEICEWRMEVEAR